MNTDFNAMLDAAWAFVPNLVAALAILIGGWIVARIVAALVTGGLKRTEVDNRLSAWIGGDGAAFPIEKAAGRGVFYLIMLFVLVAVFQA
ncbi:MAG: hypothetical protein OEN56_11105, partial [Gemmatimonadota bacterium]|nr:hypothetical protein [Gemmatimonadota bacterium]